MDAPFGLSWSEEGLLFGQFGKGIMRVSPDGGTPELIVPIDSGEMVESPQLLPGGKAVMFSVKKADESWDQGQIAVQPLAGGARKTVLQGGAAAVYVPTGHLVYAVASVLFAIPFDAGTQAVRGGAVSILEGLERGFPAAAKMGAATAHFAVSSAGTLVFMPGSRAASAGARFDLGLFDRKGAPQPLGLPPAQYVAPRVSPDGKWAAVQRIGADTDIWIADLAGSTPIRRLTFGGTNRAPVWSGDSQWVIFQSIQNDRDGIFRQRADGSGTAERLTTADSGFVHVPQSASPDGAHLLYTTVKSGAGEYGLWVLSMKDRRSSPFGVAQARSMMEAAFSPDGRWVAYSAGEAPESGNRVTESFVQPFPASGAKYQIPGPTGAAHPVWTTKGDALVTGSASNRDSLIPVATNPNFSFGQPDEIPRGARVGGGPTARRNHDPLPDGRILGVMTLGAGESSGQSAPQVAVVLNWFSDLRQRVR
jgi:serine/threonine-protein kinase